MEDHNNKNEENRIDEQYLMSIMAGETKKELDAHKNITGKASETVSHKVKTKKNYELTYDEKFLKYHTMSKRGDKSIYIRPEYHERLTRIIQIIADDQIPLYAYLDNILAHHFEMFEKEITEDFNNKYRPIF
ncbi:MULTISPECIES: DUF3408 domain-containing protein [Chryseobacterium]|jgi:hypothetical protein|uniref:DUF3408 domain-containing protein n=1 Tax=Chryseobacterium TaxID=59732 RepID=UPI001AE3AAB7|nr:MULTISPECIES: DUF3408 domain-containing protein [Chryseobacterium]MBP1164560.1 hypothetical protein [Chryseobacterium sp. PvR013]MDR6461629.1 hypothetical protein [Chryseobacterium sediminis]